MHRFERIFYAVCGVILVSWILGFGLWLMLAPYPAILYP